MTGAHYSLRKKPSNTNQQPSEIHFWRWCCTMLLVHFLQHAIYTPMTTLPPPLQNPTTSSSSIEERYHEMNSGQPHYEEEQRVNARHSSTVTTPQTRSNREQISSPCDHEHQRLCFLPYRCGWKHTVYQENRVSEKYT